MSTPYVHEYHVSALDLHKLRQGEGGVDLEPVIKNGAQVAMRVIGVKPATTAAKLGAQNGDVIESINDVALSSVENAYKAGDAAMRTKRIIVRGKRGDVPFETVLLLDP